MTSVAAHLEAASAISITLYKQSAFETEAAITLAAIVCDAGTVVEGFSGTEGPAGAAVGLVANGADRLAVGPLCARIEAGRGHNLVVLGHNG